MVACAGVYRYREFDKFKVAGVLSPGLLDPDEPFPGADDPELFDVRRGMFISRAFLYYKGDDLSNFAARVHVYPPTGNIEDWLRDDPEWKAFKPLIDRRPNRWGVVTAQTNIALDIQHPILADLGIRSIVRINRVAWKQTQPGRWTSEIRMMAYFPPNAVQPGQLTKSESVPTPTNPDQQTIMDLEKEIDKQGEYAKAHPLHIPRL